MQQSTLDWILTQNTDMKWESQIQSPLLLPLVHQIIPMLVP